MIQINTNHHCDYLCISLRFEFNLVLLNQSLLQLVIVSNDSIVNQSKAVLVVEMRMSIPIRLIAVGCPSCVPNANGVIVQLSANLTNSLDAIAAETICTRKLGLDECWITILILRY